MSTKGRNCIRPAARVAAAAIALFASIGAGLAAVPGQPGLYESHRERICSNKSFCIVNFEAVPAGSLLSATNLNCTAAALGPEPEDLTIFRLFERDAGSTTDVINKAAFPAVNVNSSFQQNETTFFGINEQVRLFFPGGRQVTLSVSFNRARSTIQMSCTLAGDLVT